MREEKREPFKKKQEEKIEVILLNSNRNNCSIVHVNVVDSVEKSLRKKQLIQSVIHLYYHILNYVYAVIA